MNTTTHYIPRADGTFLRVHVDVVESIDGDIYPDFRPPMAHVSDVSSKELTHAFSQIAAGVALNERQAADAASFVVRPPLHIPFLADFEP